MSLNKLIVLVGTTHRPLADGEKIDIVDVPISTMSDNMLRIVDGNLVLLKEDVLAISADDTETPTAGAAQTFVDAVILKNNTHTRNDGKVSANAIPISGDNLITCVDDSLFYSEEEAKKLLNGE